MARRRDQRGAGPAGPSYDQTASVAGGQHRRVEPGGGDAGRVLRLLALIAVAGGVIALTAGACVLSYTNLHDLALHAGVSTSLAKLYPAVADAMLVIAGCAVLALRGAGLLSKIYAWLCFIIGLAAIAAGSTLRPAGIHVPKRWAEVTAAIFPWALVLVAFGLLLALLRHARRGRRLTEATAARPADVTPPPQDGPPPALTPLPPPTPPAGPQVPRPAQSRPAEPVTPEAGLGPSAFDPDPFDPDPFEPADWRRATVEPDPASADHGPDPDQVNGGFDPIIHEAATDRPDAGAVTPAASGSIAPDHPSPSTQTVPRERPAPLVAYDHPAPRPEQPAAVDAGTGTGWPATPSSTEPVTSPWLTPVRPADQPPAAPPTPTEPPTSPWLTPGPPSPWLSHEPDTSPSHRRPASTPPSLSDPVSPAAESTTPTWFPRSSPDQPPSPTQPSSPSQPVTGTAPSSPAPSAPTSPWLVPMPSGQHQQQSPGQPSRPDGRPRPVVRPAEMQLRARTQRPAHAAPQTERERTQPMEPGTTPTRRTPAHARPEEDTPPASQDDPTNPGYTGNTIPRDDFQAAPALAEAAAPTPAVAEPDSDAANPTPANTDPRDPHPKEPQPKDADPKDDIPVSANQENTDQLDANTSSTADTSSEGSGNADLGGTSTVSLAAGEPVPGVDGTGAISTEADDTSNTGAMSSTGTANTGGGRSSRKARNKRGSKTDNPESEPADVDRPLGSATPPDS